MKPENFCYWLQGYFELSWSNELTQDQVNTIKNHLNLVFVHDIDPEIVAESDLTAEELQAVHDGEVPPEPVMPENIDVPEYEILHYTNRNVKFMC